MIREGGISGQTVAQIQVDGLLQDGFLFGPEGSSVGGDAGLLQILQGCFSTTRIQIKLVVMDASVSL